MNINKFLFKVFAVTLVTLKLTIIFSLIVMAFRAMRNAPFVLQDEILASLLIGFGLGMAVSVWNAMEFDNFRYIDMSYYLKPSQKVEIQLSENVSPDEIFSHLKSSLANDKNWKQATSQHQGELDFVVKSAYKASDAVSIETTPDNKLQISSKPKGLMWLVDFGRNYLNIIKVLNIIKTFQTAR